MEPPEADSCLTAKNRTHQSVLPAAIPGGMLSSRGDEEASEFPGIGNMLSPALRPFLYLRPNARAVRTSAREGGSPEETAEAAADRVGARACMCEFEAWRLGCSLAPPDS
ncbi:hypothetical protein C8035_v001594 [Colletotrichum spinosum]|uniref:Uncharacterized protein n=1 Tax=Colletotrichum spinosum TaxID=1347390 RepID=A0A4R8Q442_9PEZI|nr:hypothetical protein C8035_v001594 [Colletotrichum spinosum]